jgi:hypothetical protein
MITQMWSQQADLSLKYIYIYKHFKYESFFSCILMDLQFTEFIVYFTEI